MHENSALKRSSTCCHSATGAGDSEAYCLQGAVRDRCRGALSPRPYRERAPALVDEHRGRAHATRSVRPRPHLFTQTKGEPASLTPFAVIGPRSRVSYPARPPPPQINDRARAGGRRDGRFATPDTCRVPTTEAHLPPKPCGRDLGTKEQRPDRDRRTHELGDRGTDLAPLASMVRSAKSAFHVGDHVSCCRAPGSAQKGAARPQWAAGPLVRSGCVQFWGFNFLARRESLRDVASS